MNSIKNYEDLQVFEFNGFNVRVMELDGEFWFSAFVVLHLLGHRTNALKKLDSDEIMTLGKDGPQLGKSENVTGVLMVNESGLFTLIGESKSPRAQEFKHWITNDVLPVMTARLSSPDAEQTEDAETRLEDLKSAQEARINKLIADRAEAEKRSVTSYYDVIFRSTEPLDIKSIAENYCDDAELFKSLLKSFHILVEHGGSLIPKAEYTECGIIAAIPHDEWDDPLYDTPLWTQAGHLFLYDFLKRNGILPIMESEFSKEELYEVQ